MREKVSCRDCERISQPPAPFHVIARGWAGPSLLAMLVFGKFGEHQPLNRQADRYAREGVPLSLSTLADQAGACCSVLEPIFKRIEAHVFAAGRLHGDDTTVPVLACGKTDIARSWVYVRDDRPFAGPAPPAAVFYFSRDRGGTHPQAHLAKYAGILQADAFGGYARLYEPERNPGPITEAACWSHARRKFFALADLAANAQRKTHGKAPVFVSPTALEAVRRIDALGRKSWLFAGSDRGGQRAAMMYSLIVTAKMNDIDPQAWLADVLARIADHPAQKLDDLLPWSWRSHQQQEAA